MKIFKYLITIVLVILLTIPFIGFTQSDYYQFETIQSLDTDIIYSPRYDVDTNTVTFTVYTVHSFKSMSFWEYLGVYAYFYIYQMGYDIEDYDKGKWKSSKWICYTSQKP
ncbi:MAG: hypothetical protein FWE22_02215 [Firmicutes bacterium]|nr:hypothetical protein [Bacillota bacterium]